MTANLGPQDRKWIAWLITVALVVVGTLVGVQFPVPPTPEAPLGGTTNFTAVTAEDLTATDDLAVGDDAAITGDLSLTGTGTFATWITLSATDEVSATADFVPTASYQSVEAASGITMVITTTDMVAGTVLFLVNEGANSIVLEDSSPHALTAAETLATGDSILLIFDGTLWREMSRADN